MKNSFLIVMLIAMACGGRLSDEERKKLREGMEKQKIVRVTEPEIMTATLEKGHAIVGLLENKRFSQKALDSVGQVHGVHIRWVVPGQGNALAIEQELIDAYISAMVTGSAEENLQKVYTSANRDAFDSLLYSKPSVTRLPDGSEQLDGIWNIYIAKKQIVLDISKNK
jgi:hypothetical protein